MSGLASRTSGPPVHDGPHHPDHIDGILVFPLAGRARDDVRAGMRVTTYKKRTLVAYEVDESSGELVVNILGIFDGRQNWETAFGEEQVDPTGSR